MLSSIDLIKYNVTYMEHELDLYRKLMLLMMRSKQRMAELMEQRRMTPIQGMLLMLFEPGEGRSMHELSELMACDASNTTGLIDRLDTHGLIERTTDPTDRRVKVIKLSPAGEECRLQVLHSMRQAEAVGLQKLTAAERLQFAVIVGKLLETED